MARRNDGPVRFSGPATARAWPARRGATGGRARLAAWLGLCLAGVLAAPALSAHPVTFHVEVPYCTPRNATLYLRSNRLNAAVFEHDPLTRVDATHASTTVDVQTSLDAFEYKYSHGLCNEDACPGIEKDFLFDCTDGERAPRRLASPDTAEVFDLVYIWRDALRTFDAAGQAVGCRTTAEKVAFCWPYLSLSHENGGEVTVSYDAYDAGTVRLEYGRDASYGQSLERTGSHRNHFALTGLVAGATYHYRVIEDGVATPDLTFVAPPSPGTPFRFAHVGDMQYQQGAGDRERVAALLAETAAFGPELVVGTGDMVSSRHGESSFLPPELARFNVFFGLAAPTMAAAPFLTAMGNHEEDVDYYWDAFAFPAPDAPRIDHYFFRYGSAFFVALYTGTTAGYDIEGMLASQTYWLRDALAQAAADPTIRWKVVYLHRGPHSQGANHPPAESDPIVFNTSGGRPSWAQLWEQYGVDLVLAGHNHNFTLAEANGIRFLTTCSGSYLHPLWEPWYAETRYAERTCTTNLFSVGAATLSFTAVRPDGSHIAEAAFDLCRADADCAELPAPCPHGATWACEDRECVPTCAPPPADPGPEPPASDVGEPHDVRDVGDAGAETEIVSDLAPLDDLELAGGEAVGDSDLGPGDVAPDALADTGAAGDGAADARDATSEIADLPPFDFGFADQPGDIGPDGPADGQAADTGAADGLADAAAPEVALDAAVDGRADLPPDDFGFADAPGADGAAPDGPFDASADGPADVPPYDFGFADAPGDEADAPAGEFDAGDAVRDAPLAPDAPAPDGWGDAAAGPADAASGDAPADAVGPRGDADAPSAADASPGPDRTPDGAAADPGREAAEARPADSVGSADPGAGGGGGGGSGCAAGGVAGTGGLGGLLGLLLAFGGGGRRRRGGHGLARRHLGRRAERGENAVVRCGLFGRRHE